ncbi:MAG TPA: hypothetical protein ACHBZ9_00590, partial [Arsenophonus nasoniae]|uniref:hypothetical protein n=1 Tax=Arsenophonus nasoniae TaxID=638 RepID=UPI003878F980
RLEITLSEEMLTGTKHNKSIPSPFCNKGWLLLLTLKAIQFPNHEPVFFPIIFDLRLVVFIFYFLFNFNLYKLANDSILVNI